MPAGDAGRRPDTYSARHHRDVADIDSYSPFIQAVFGSAPAIVTCLTPFPTVGRGSRILYLSVYQPVIVARQPLCVGRRAALLDVPVLAARFDITEEGLRIYVSGSTNPAFVGG